MTNSKLNPASEAISMVKAAQTNEEDIPVTPLPDPVLLWTGQEPGSDR